MIVADPSVVLVAAPADIRRLQLCQSLVNITRYGVLEYCGRICRGFAEDQHAVPPGVDRPAVSRLSGRLVGVDPSRTDG